MPSVGTSYYRTRRLHVVLVTVSVLIVIYFLMAIKREKISLKDSQYVTVNSREKEKVPDKKEIILSTRYFYLPGTTARTTMITIADTTTTTTTTRITTTTSTTSDVAHIYLNKDGTGVKDNVSSVDMCKTKPRFDDWRFSCYEKCPESIKGIRQNPIDVSEICSDYMITGNVRWTEVYKDRLLYTVPYNSTCSHRLIESYCNSTYRVPNVVHYVWFTKHQMEFIHFLSFISVLKVQKPCLIFLHADILPYGMFWNYTLQLVSNIVHIYVEPSPQIHGRVLGNIEHKSDVHRLRSMRDYGGMYFDVDQILLKSLDPLRNYSFTQSLEVYNLSLANSLLISAPNAEFVVIWLDNYRTYNDSQWSYHSTVLPFKLSKEHPDLIHIEGNAFVRPNFSRVDLIYYANYRWNINYSLHIYLRRYSGKHDLHDIRKLNTTIGSMSRFILYDSKELCFTP